MENARVRPVDGVDVGRAQSDHRGGCDPLPAGEEARLRAGFSTSCAPIRAGTEITRARRLQRRCSPDRHRASPRPVKYGPDVIAALTVCWAVLGMPAGKRLAPMLGELVAVLRHFGELSIDEGTAALLASMSAATIDRRLADQRAKYRLKGRVRTKPGSLLKSQIPVRTWAEWDDARPASSRSTWSATTAATGLAAMHLPSPSPTSPPAGPRTAQCPTRPPNASWQHSMTSPARCRSRSWGWTPTTDRNSSTTTCWVVPRTPDHLHPGATGQ